MAQNIINKFCIFQDEAIARITNWRQDQETLINALEGTPGHIHEGMPMLHVKAFTFEYIELKELMRKIDLHNSDPSAPPISGLRLYLGVKVHPDEPVSPSPCLVAVGVANFDPNSSMGGDDVLKLATIDHNNEGIYDFSYPCPATCANKGHSIMDPQPQTN
jgi:hypothetical protein